MERRLQARVALLSNVGMIALANGTKIKCVVVNLSKGGASIEIDSPTRVPDSFVLTMGADGMNHACRVVWRLGKRIGLAFE